MPPGMPSDMHLTRSAALVQRSNVARGTQQASELAGAVHRYNQRRTVEAAPRACTTLSPSSGKYDRCAMICAAHPNAMRELRARARFRADGPQIDARCGRA